MKSIKPYIFRSSELSQFNIDLIEIFYRIYYTVKDEEPDSFARWVDAGGWDIP